MSSKTPCWSIESNDHFDMDYRRDRSNYLADEDLRPKREHTEQHQRFCRDAYHDIDCQTGSGEEARRRNAEYNRCKNKIGPRDEQAHRTKNRARADQAKMNETEWSEDCKNALNRGYETASGRGKKHVINKGLKSTEPQRHTDPDVCGPQKSKKVDSGLKSARDAYACHQEEKSAATFVGDIDMRCTSVQAMAMSGSVAVSDHVRAGSMSAGAFAQIGTTNVSKRIADVDSRQKSLTFSVNNSNMCNKEGKSIVNDAKSVVQRLTFTRLDADVAVAKPLSRGVQHKIHKESLIAGDKKIPSEPAEGECVSKIKTGASDEKSKLKIVSKKHDKRSELRGTGSSKTAPTLIPLVRNEHRSVGMLPAKTSAVAAVKNNKQTSSVGRSVRSVVSLKGNVTPVPRSSREVKESSAVNVLKRANFSESAASANRTDASKIGAAKDVLQRLDDDVVLTPVTQKGANKSRVKVETVPGYGRMKARKHDASDADGKTVMPGTKAASQSASIGGCDVTGVLGRVTNNDVSSKPSRRIKLKRPSAAADAEKESLLEKPTVKKRRWGGTKRAVEVFQTASSVDQVSNATDKATTGVITKDGDANCDNEDACSTMSSHMELRLDWDELMDDAFDDDLQTERFDRTQSTRDPDDLRQCLKQRHYRKRMEDDFNPEMSRTDTSSISGDVLSTSDAVRLPSKSSAVLQVDQTASSSIAVGETTSTEARQPAAATERSSSAAQQQHQRHRNRRRCSESRSPKTDSRDARWRPAGGDSSLDPNDFIRRRTFMGFGGHHRGAYGDAVHRYRCSVSRQLVAKQSTVQSRHFYYGPERLAWRRFCRPSVDEHRGASDFARPW